MSRWLHPSPVLPFKLKAQLREMSYLSLALFSTKHIQNNTHKHTGRDIKGLTLILATDGPVPIIPFEAVVGSGSRTSPRPKPQQKWATFPLTDPNCQGTVSCQAWLRVSLLGETEGTGSSLSVFVLHLHTKFIPLLPRCHRSGPVATVLIFHRR